MRNLFETTSNKQPKVYVIAEIGINHNGSVETCKELIVAAKKSGADAVKLQTLDPDANYIPGTESYEIFKKFELEKKETEIIFEFANEISIDIFSTVGDFKTLEWIQKLNPVAYKISSGLLTHFPLIREVAKLKKPILMSTGMSDLAEVDTVVQYARKQGVTELALFQCTSLYPAPLAELNLATIRFMQERYDLPVGFSDHSLGIEAAVLSVAAGGIMLEKHFTLNKNQESADHKISLEPKEFSDMVSKIRMVEMIMGDKDKKLNSDLILNKAKYQRCIVVSRNVSKGDIITAETLAIKRLLPGTSGLLPYKYYDILGETFSKNLNKNDPVTDEVIGNE